MEIPSPNVVFEDLKVGLRKKYDMLVAALKKNNASSFIQDEEMTSIITGVHLHVVRLDRQYSSLPFEIMKLQWLTKSESLMEAYKSFVLDLVSVHTGIYVHDCVKGILKNFKPAPSTTEADFAVATFHHNHALLSSIIAIVPKVTLDLEHLLPASFVHHNLDKHIQLPFISNMLQMTCYLPALRCLILKLTLKHFIELDTRAQRKDIEESTKEEEEEEEDNEEDEDEEKVLRGHMKTADTLDDLMCVMFKFVEDTCLTKGLLQHTATKNLYTELMDSFHTLLLTPSQTCHAQFVFFYVCSLHKSIEENFLEVLWRKVVSPSQEAIYRQLSSLYLAGLLSRATYISLDTIQRHLTRMRDWIEAYSDNCSDSCQHLQPQQQQQRHSPFYFMCQAFFYVVVCRHKMILDTPHGHAFLMSLYPQKMAFSRMNPLNFCLPSLAEAFCAVIRNNQIAFCDTVLEKNRRLMMSQHASTTPSLLSYAPFDPYLLKKSKAFITPLYQQYDDSAFHPEKLPCQLREEMEYLDLEENMSLSPKLSSLFHYHMLSASNH